jgi:hypothetical protein
MKSRKEWSNQVKCKGNSIIIVSQTVIVLAKKTNKFWMEIRFESLLQRYKCINIDIIREKGIERVTVQGLINDL